MLTPADRSRTPEAVLPQSAGTVKDSVLSGSASHISLYPQTDGSDKTTVPSS